MLYDQENIPKTETINEKILAQKMRTFALDRDSYAWSEKECLLLAERYADGFGISEIALELQRTEDAICQKIKALGLFQHETGISRLRCPRIPKYQCENCKVAPSQCPRYCMKGDGSDV